MSENIDYKNLITEIKEKKEKEKDKSKEKKTIDDYLGKSVDRLTIAITNTTQYTNEQLKCFSMFLSIHDNPELNPFYPETKQMEKHLKDISRKNASEIIDFADKVSRMVRLNSFPDFSLNDMEIDEKRRLFKQKRLRY